MSELVGEFSALPEGHQTVLQIAQQEHDIQITPLQQLVGGRTGAYLYLVSVSPSGSEAIEHLVLKLDRSRPGKADEMDKHELALEQAPADFAREHMANLAFEKVETDESLAIFYTIAGDSLHRYRTLASHASQYDLQAIFRAATTGLLAEWNAEMRFERAIHPHDLLNRWLGRRVQPGGNIEQFLAEVCNVNPEIGGLIIGGEIYPNPLAFAREPEAWGAVRPIDAMIGFQHGDLNITNLLVKLTQDEGSLDGYYLIDLALFQAGVPLLFDNAYLEMSYLLGYVPRVTLTNWMSLAGTLAREDIPNPQQVPAELAGASAVIGAGRLAFDEWVQSTHPTLSDDLWGQFWLAGIAAGLNYCNKAVLSDQERLAGLIHAAAHLKRYAMQFGMPLPTEAVDIQTAEQSTDVLRVRPSTARATHHLPIPPTAYIDSTNDVTTVRDMLLRDDVSMLTLTGPGGVGKTRLSLEVARSLTDEFEDGVIFVDLAPITAPELVLSTIARTLGVREGSQRPLRESLQDDLRDRRLLLLLDNFEQILDAAPDIADLLATAPQMKVLVTSRTPLNLRAEHEYPVAPLSLPVQEDHPAPESLSQYEAVRLFISRAQAVKANFTVTNENAPAVAEICYRLDGLPLAIELAAARIKLLPPEKILARLDDRLSLLTGGARDLPERHQTLRGAIDWSYQLLDADEQRLFALLAVFPNCTFEAVESVASLSETELDALDGLASLVDKSLVRIADSGSGEQRFMMLETIREYAGERLAEDAALSEAARHAHATYFADFMRRQWQRQASAGWEVALREIEAELENVRAAWGYWVAAGDLEQLHRISDGLWMLYDNRGWYHATVDLTEDLLTVLAETPSSAERVEQEIMLQTSLARAIMYSKGYVPEVEQHYTAALELCKQQGEIPQLFPVLRALSSFYNYIADTHKAAEMGRQILELAERQDNTRMRVEGHLVRGYNLMFMGDLTGMEHLEQAMALYDPDQHGVHRYRMGNDPGVAAFTISALMSWMGGAPDRALELANKAVALAYKVNHSFSMCYALYHTGMLHLWRREPEMSQGRAQAVLDLAGKQEFPVWRAVAMCLHGASLAGMGFAEEGLVEIGAGMAAYQGMTSPPVFWPLLLHMQATAYAMAGDAEQGLRLLDRTFEILGPDYRDSLGSSFCRLKGDMLLAISPDNVAEAEEWYQTALDTAEAYAAPMYKLQAAVSLSRVWQQQGREDDAHALIEDALAGIAEGFSTPDLKEAQALLEELS